MTVLLSRSLSLVRRNTLNLRGSLAAARSVTRSYGDSSAGHEELPSFGLPAPQVLSASDVTSGLSSSQVLSWYKLEDVKKTFPEGLCGGLGSSPVFKTTQGVMMRSYSYTTMNLLKSFASESSKKSTISRSGIFIDGPKGCGKSTVLNQSVHYARKTGWIALVIPSSRVLTDVGGGYIVQNKGSDIYYQPDVAQDIMRSLKSCHGDKLANIELRSDESKKLLGGEAETATISDLVDLGLKSWDRSGAVYDALFDELTRVTEYPVLVAVDEAGYLHSECPSGMRDSEGKPLFPSSLSVARHLTHPTELGARLANGAVIYATQGDVGAKEFISDSGNQNGLAKVHVRKLTMEEATGMAAHCQHHNLLDAEYDEGAVALLQTVAAGNCRALMTHLASQM